MTRRNLRGIEVPKGLGQEISDTIGMDGALKKANRAIQRQTALEGMRIARLLASTKSSRWLEIKKTLMESDRAEFAYDRLSAVYERYDTLVYVGLMSLSYDSNRYVFIKTALGKEVVRSVERLESNRRELRATG